MYRVREYAHIYERLAERLHQYIARECKSVTSSCLNQTTLSRKKTDPKTVSRAERWHMPSPHQKTTDPKTVSHAKGCTRLPLTKKRRFPQLLLPQKKVAHTFCCSSVRPCSIISTRDLRCGRIAQPMRMAICCTILMPGRERCGRV